MKPSRAFLAGSLALVAASLPPSHAFAAEIGHFAPGVLGIRDYVMPAEPGFYGMVNTFFYETQRINDRNGDAIDSVTISPGPGPGVTLGLDVDVDLSVIAPAVVWVSDWKLLGARYGAFISPSFANASIGAALSSATGAARNAKIESFHAGDLLVQPIWLDWKLEHWQFAAGYGFWAPVGHYDTHTVTLPIVGSVEVEDSDNVGLGFWTHQIQLATAFYPFDNPATAITGALTYEVHGDKQDFDLTPGQNLTLNWGVSQYLPLRADHSLLLEVGPAGYSSWQVSDDTGSDAANGVRDSVHGAGFQLGLTYVPWGALLNFHYFHEFSSEDRFEGTSLGLNAAFSF
jgi:hypothetical protein